MERNAIEVDALNHKGAKRLNIPTAEIESVMREEDKTPVPPADERRNRYLAPQLGWRGKDKQGWSDPADPDSRQGLRYDQFIAPLVKAVQELDERLQRVEADTILPDTEPPGTVVEAAGIH
jgi:hypothetical protein